MSDTAHILSMLIGIPEERRQELIQRYENGQLTAEDKEQLKQHILRAMVELEHRKAELENS